MKNWKKYLSPLLSIVMLLNIVSQTAVPLVAYADPEEDPIEEVENTESSALITTTEELIDFVDLTVVIEDIEIVEVNDEDEVIIYSAVNEEDEEFFILDEEGSLELEVGEAYASISGIVLEVDGVYLIAPATTDDIVVAEVIDLDDSDSGESADEDEESDPQNSGDESEGEDNDDESEVDIDEDGKDEDTDAGDDFDGESVSTFALGDNPALLQEQNFDLSLMHMNDTHARVENYAHMYTAIEGYRAENPEALLFHAGDVFSGTLYFNRFEGRADLDALNLMGIDAMTFGNHEFDLGSPHTALANFVGDANFPFLGTNINFSQEPLLADLTETGSNPSIYDRLVFEIDGQRIGVFGLLTEDTRNIASPGNVTFNDYITAAEQAVAAFEADGINKIIALTHLGYASSPTFGNDLVLANQVDGIDIIVGGHSHTRLSVPVLVESGDSPTVIVQAGANADYLGTLNVTFNAAGEIVDHTGELINATGTDEDGNPVYPANQEIINAIADYKTEVDEISNEEIEAEAVRDIINPRHNEDEDTDSVRANETPLGNLITDAMLAKTKELYPDTVIAFQNGGGIRAPIDAGPITVGEVINVLPFGNNPVVVDLSGEELKELFEISYGADQRPAGGLEENGGFLHVSGMEIDFDSTRPAGDRIWAMYVNINNELVPIEPDQMYKVTTNAFTGSGGDGLTPLAEAYAEGRVQDTGAIDWEQLRDYMIEAQYLDGTVDPVVEGRIVDSPEEDAPTPDPDPEPSRPVPTPEPTPDPDATDPGAEDVDGTPVEVEVDGEEELPAAGTNMEGSVYAGITILLAGSVLFVISKRKRA